jgi:hypothetical protein
MFKLIEQYAIKNLVFSGSVKRRGALHSLGHLWLYDNDKENKYWNPKKRSVEQRNALGLGFLTFAGLQPHLTVLMYRDPQGYKWGQLMNSLDNSTQLRKTRTNTHVSSGIRTHVLRVQAINALASESAATGPAVLHTVSRISRQFPFKEICHYLILILFG